MGIPSAVIQNKLDSYESIYVFVLIFHIGLLQTIVYTKVVKERLRN